MIIAREIKLNLFFNIEVGPWYTKGGAKTAIKENMMKIIKVHWFVVIGNYDCLHGFLDVQLKYLYWQISLYRHYKYAACRDCHTILFGKKQ